MLRTPRARLDPFSESDRQALTALFRDPAVRRYLLDDQLVDELWVEEEISDSHERFGAASAGLWCVRLEGGPEIVGFVGFRPFFDPPQLQLLYGLLPSAWGRGLATEVARAVADYAFGVLDFPSIEAAIDEPNVASGRVLERLGMTVVRRTADGDGTVFYSVDAKEWTPVT